jgi:hypothetical protein
MAKLDTRELPGQNNSATPPQLISIARVFFGASRTLATDWRMFVGHKLAKLLCALVTRCNPNIRTKAQPLR